MRKSLAVSIVYGIFLARGVVCAQNVCGLFETAPNATADYTYHDGTLHTVVLPLNASFAISCEDYSLDALIRSPIIGVDEGGNEIFPTGLSYPLPVASVFQDPLGYYGALLETQYHYQWSFGISAGETMVWNGSVGWVGGRFEQTDLTDVRLVSVPECSGLSLLGIGVGSLLFWCRMQRGRLSDALLAGAGGKAGAE